jgi:hypothetical protein
MVEGWQVEPVSAWFVSVLKLWGFDYCSGFPDDAGMIIVIFAMASI